MGWRFELCQVPIIKQVVFGFCNFVLIAGMYSTRLLLLVLKWRGVHFGPIEASPIGRSFTEHVRTQVRATATANKTQIPVPKPATHCRLAQELLSQHQRRSDHRLRLAMWQHTLHTKWNFICTFLRALLVDRVLCVDIVHRIDLSDWDVTVQVSRKADYIPERLLHDDCTGLHYRIEFVDREHDRLQAGEDSDLWRQRVFTARHGILPVHGALHDSLLFYHVVVGVVGGADVDLVFGGWS